MNHRSGKNKTSRPPLEGGTFCVLDSRLFHFELCTGLELYHFLSGDGDFLLGSGIDTLALSTFADREGAESEKCNLIFCLDGVCDRIEGGIDSCLGLILSQVGLLSHCIDEFSFIHIIVS